MTIAYHLIHLFIIYTSLAQANIVIPCFIAIVHDTVKFNVGFHHFFHDKKGK